MLNDADMAYIRGLMADPKWKSILHKLKVAVPPPMYKPGSDRNQYEEWIYKSGGHAAIKSMLELLSDRQIID